MLRLVRAECLFRAEFCVYFGLNIVFSEGRVLCLV